MRLVYLGTPEAAVAPLRALAAAGHTIELVVSQPDRKRGRGSALVPSPVKQAAVELGLPVTDSVDDVLNTTAELGVVVAFGRLIKPHLLATMPYVNIHFSLLPRWRGAAPVERAILAGDIETGCCLMALEEGLDTGPVYRRVVTPIDASESAADLRTRLVSIGSTMLVEALVDGFRSLGSPVPQSGEPTHAAKLRAEDFHIDWSQSVATVHATVRLGQAWTTFRGKRIKILQGAPSRVTCELSAQVAPVFPGAIDGTNIRCADGWIELITVQPEGKPPMPAAAWLNGARPASGELLGIPT